MLKYYLTSLLKAHLTLEGCNFKEIESGRNLRFLNIKRKDICKCCSLNILDGLNKSGELGKNGRFNSRG